MADPSVSLCDEANVDGYVHIADEVLRSLTICMDEGKRDHYLFRDAALAKCERCLAFGLHHGVDLSRGAASHLDWIALERARASNASPEILRLLTRSVWPSLRSRAFCAWVELDMYVRVPGRIDRRCISQLTPRSRDHHLFLHAAGSLCKVCVRAWLDRGVDTSRGTPCEPLKSAFRWAEEARGDDELLSVVRASAAVPSCSRSAKCERATIGAARCGRPIGQHGRQAFPEKRPSSSSSSVSRVLAVQRRNVCAQVGAYDRSFFPDFWSLGADDQGRSVAVASAALSGDLERLKDIFESDHFYSASRGGRA